MKIRVFQNMDNLVFRVVVCTEDWSEGDLDLMDQFGEPEINVGGELCYIVDGEQRCKVFGNDFVRVMHGFPYTRGFDSRDYESVAEAVAVGTAWKEMVVRSINAAIVELRTNMSPLPTEEVTQV